MKLNKQGGRSKFGRCWWPKVNLIKTHFMEFSKNVLKSQKWGPDEQDH